MAFFQKHRIFIFLSIFLVISDSAFVFLTFTQAKNDLHQEVSKLTTNYFSAFDIAYQATQDNMLQIANLFANTPKYQALFLKGKHAVEQEGGDAGGEKSKQARAALNEAVAKNWQQFSHKFKARVFQFHLGPGSTSFLRVHKPEKFGDNIDDVRHTIVDTNKHHQPVSGFETGRVYSGIRGTSPVFAINDAGQQEYVGAIEAGATFSLVLNGLTSTFNINAAILLYERHLRKNMWPDLVQQRLQKTPATNGLVLEETTSDQITSLETITADSPPFTIENHAIHIEIRTLNDHHYLYATRSLRDYFGSKHPEEPDAGQIIIWHDITDLYAQRHQHLTINAYYAITAYFVIELLIFLAIRLLSRRLNHVIEQQTVELNSRNDVLKQLIQGKPLATLLESIVLAIEQSDSAKLCSILLLDDEGKHLTLGAAPHLPDFYNDAIDGLEIGDGVGSCGTAAFTRQRVIVNDIQTHPYWTPFKELAAKANLGACWSEPIIGSKNQVLGTLAIYHQQATTPTKENLKQIASAAQLTAIVIDRKQADDDHQLSSRVFNAAHEGIMITDARGEIITVNPMFSDITGYSREEVLGQTPNILSSGKHGDEFYADMWQSIATQGHWQGEVWNRKKDGSLYAELLTISALADDDGQAHHYVGLFSDITHNKEQQKSLELMAHYDVLTKLPNRALFADRFQRAIIHSKRNKTLLAVCFLDLDNFKPVNDNYGHEAGDQLLIEVAVRLKSTLREDDTVSRQGGDEFALLLSNFDSVEQCEELLRRIHRVLAQPYFIAGATHYIGASSGTTIYPLDDGDIDTLVRHADQAMYQAKLAGKNHYRLFDAGDDQKIISQHTKLQEIRRALENNEFCLYYQPKVNMKTGKVFGAEALIRWLHPEQGLIPPLAFLPLLDGTTLEVELGDWVINKALDQTVLWQQQGIELEISVNISAHHLQSSSFITHLNEALLRHPTIASTNFQLEILESSALGDLDIISSIIQTCRDLLGVNIALDDFGTGYSSLTHLRNLHANTIKIDQSFIRDMLDDPNDYAIIEGVIGLAESFDRTVIAEGVETTEHGIMLLVMGCHEAQGYGISRPLPADDIPNWLTHYQPNQHWITCGKTQRTPKEIKLKLLRIATYHWYESFMTKQQSASPAVWPLMNPSQCHHGAWIKRAYKEQLFDEAWLHSLELAHNNMHRLATKIMVKQQDNEKNNVTTEDIDNVHAAYEAMLLILKSGA